MREPIDVCALVRLCPIRKACDSIQGLIGNCLDEEGSVKDGGGLLGQTPVGSECIPMAHGPMACCNRL